MATGIAGNPIFLEDDGDDDTISEFSQNPKPAKRLCISEPKLKPEQETTLGIHTDGCIVENAAIGKLGLTATVVQCGLHAVDTTFIASLEQTEPASKCYSKVDTPEQYKMRRIHVRAGSAVFWNGWTAHTNENTDRPNKGVINCEHDVTSSTIEGAIEKLKKYGVAVLLDVLNPDEQQAVIAGMIDDIRRVAPPGTPVWALKPPGSIGCLIVKCYALPNTTNAQRLRLNIKIRKFYSIFYGIPPEDLTLSNDAITWKPPSPSSPEIPKRCGIFISYGPYAAMGPKEADKKLKGMQAGKSSSHNPTRYRAGGGPGHMSNPKEGNTGHWKTVLDPISIEQRQALGIRP